jgi:ATP-dependent protease ClpP protease subunit
MKHKTQNTSEGFVERWFTHNLDLETRTIYMGSLNNFVDGESGVDNFMAEYFIKGIHILENINTDPIIIVMNNPGGEWYHGMAIYDAIVCSPCKIIMKVYGHAMSMGSIILQAADYRIMMPNARMMIHYGFSGFYGHAKTSERWANENTRVHIEMENIYLQSWLDFEKKYGISKLQKIVNSAVNNTKLIEYPQPPLTKIKLSSDNDKKINQLRFALRDLLKIDTILSSTEAVELGFADVIYGSPDFVQNIQEFVEPIKKVGPRGKKTKNVNNS